MPWIGYVLAALPFIPLVLLIGAGWNSSGIPGG